MTRMTKPMPAMQPILRKKRARDNRLVRSLARHKPSCILIAVSLLTAGLLLLFSRFFGGLSVSFANWYSDHIFPFFGNTLGRFFGLFPFSCYEMGIYAVILFCIFTVLYAVIRLFSMRKGTARALGRLLYPFAAFLSVLFLVFTLTCGIQYGRSPFSEVSGFTLKKSSAEELRALVEILLEENTEAVGSVPVDEKGCTTFTSPHSTEPAQNFDLHAEALAAMKSLGERYPSLSGYYPQPKPVLFSRGMSYMNITGVYSPFTVEANYNRDTPHYSIPFTVCHELSHLKGFMREDEANFVAYLACSGSEHPYLRYSGSALALVYTLNAYYPVSDTESYNALYDRLPEQLQRDYQANSEYWKQFETPVAEVSEAANDLFLKANNQSDGVRSYGRMVDLLLAYYSEEIAERLSSPSHT